MNKDAVLFHLREAAEDLNEKIKEFEQDPDFDKTGLQLALGHIYHHLNTAWNGRDQTEEQFRECTDTDFDRFRRFPKEKDFADLAALDDLDDL